MNEDYVVSGNQKTGPGEWITNRTEITKRQFRNALDMEYERHMKEVYQDPDSAAECDIRLFWKLVKKQKTRTSRTYPEIHDNNGSIHNESESMAEAFAKHFEQIYTTSEDDTFNEQFRQHIENSYTRIEEECTKMSGDIPGGPITVEKISTIVSKLKRRKAPGQIG